MRDKKATDLHENVDERGKDIYLRFVGIENGWGVWTPCEPPTLAAQVASPGGYTRVRWPFAADPALAMTLADVLGSRHWFFIPAEAVDLPGSDGFDEMLAGLNMSQAPAGTHVLDLQQGWLK